MRMEAIMRIEGILNLTEGMSQEMKDMWKREEFAVSFFDNENSRRIMLFDTLVEAEEFVKTFKTKNGFNKDTGRFED